MTGAPGRRVTRADVARRAGTSVAVVSYVVNDGPRRVSPPTRDRVLAAIEATGYRPDAVARALAGGPTHTFGLLVPDVSDRFFAALVHEIQGHAFGTGHQILLGDSAHDPLRERTLLAEMLEWRVDAVLLASVDPELPLPPGLGRGTPVVLLDRRATHDGLSSVTVDDVGGARAATEHLGEHGYTSVACLAGPATLPAAGQRRAGWALGLEAAGLAVAAVVEAPYTRAAGYAAARGLLGAPGRPDAVFVSNEQQALGLLRAARDLGLRVPADVGVVTMDGSQDAEYAVPSLSAVVQPVAEIAAHATRLLGARPHCAEQVTTGFVLVLRGSCGCPEPA